MKTRRAIGAMVAKWLRLSATILALLPSGALVLAQQPAAQKRVQAPGDMPPVPQAGASELAKENNDRVAASAIQLRTVLANDPGLVVELKRWIAKEATDNGQVRSLCSRNALESLCRLRLKKMPHSHNPGSQSSAHAKPFRPVISMRRRIVRHRKSRALSRSFRIGMRHLLRRISLLRLRNEILRTFRTQRFCGRMPIKITGGWDL